jgi:hypothetical protein
MKKFRVFYWKETGDDCIDCEIDLQAKSFDEAYKIFRDMYALVKIREITEIVGI